LGINGKMLGKWTRQLTLAQQVQAQGRTSYEAFPGQGRTHDEELARLRRENAALKMERDVLKKRLRRPTGTRSRSQSPDEVCFHAEAGAALASKSTLPHLGRFTYGRFTYGHFTYGRFTYGHFTYGHFT
jgi:transposase-like protein